MINRPSTWRSASRSARDSRDLGRCFSLCVSRWVSLCFLLLTLHPSKVSADTYPKNTALDVRHYRFEFELFEGEQRIEGRATIELEVVGDGVRALTFDLVGTAHASAGSGTTDTLGTATGKSARDTRTGPRSEPRGMLWSENNSRFSLPIEFVGRAGDGAGDSEPGANGEPEMLRQTLLIDQRRHRFEIPVEFAPTLVKIDPATEVLLRATREER